MQDFHRLIIILISDLDWGQWSLTSQALVFFLVLAILTEVVVARPTMYSNSRTRGRSRRHSQGTKIKPKWVNPCGIDPSFVRNHAIFSYHEVTPLSDQELIQNILLSAKNALVHSDDFKEKFVSRIVLPCLAFRQIKGSMRDCSWLPSQYSAS